MRAGDRQDGGFKFLKAKVGDALSQVKGHSGL